MMDNLKPCPWCGKTPTLFAEGDKGQYKFVACNGNECGVEPCTLTYDSEKEAITAWNERIE